MQPNLNFRVGSVTKLFVATAVLKLVDEGRIAPADSVDRWLPGILPYGAEITVRELLNHTSGVPNYPDSIWRALHRSPQERLRAWSPQELVGLVSDRPAIGAPGAAWSYSNVGYILLGLVVEAATGRPLASELSRLVFEPAGLQHSSLPVGSTTIPSPSARGYSPRLTDDLEVVDGPLVDFTEQDPSYAWAAGAAVSNLEDLTRFLRALLGGKLLPPELMAEMLATVSVPPESVPLPLYDRYGLGIVEVDTPAGSLFGGPGGIPGFFTMVLSTRDARRQMGVMVNIGERANAELVETFIRATRSLGERLLS
jgi:D-alanyl-D-alanine carboxypeptidase